MRKRYNCIKQHDITDCGAACLATISKQYGYKIPISRIREVAGTDKQGTNVLGMIKAAEHLGFNAKGVKGDPESFFSEFPLPAIAHVVVNKSLLHYVVIHEITNEAVIIADPAEGIKEMIPEEFFELWSGVLIILTPATTFEKGDETTGLFNRFGGLLKPQKKLVMNIFFASILHTVLGIFGAFYFKFLVDDILPYCLDNTLVIISIGVMILTIFKVTTNGLRSYMMLFLSQKLDIPLILGYYNHVVDLPLNFFGTRKVGEIISRFMDAGKIREAISGATLTIMVDTLMAVFGGIILFRYNAVLFGITVLMLIAYGSLVFLFNKPIRDANRKTMEENSQLTSFLVESLNGIETVKSFNSMFKMGQINNLRQSLTIFISTIGANAILWIGATSVMKGNMTIGQLLVFNSLMVYFIDPIKNLINLQPMLQTAIVASERLGEILDLEKERLETERDSINLNKLRGNIVIKDLTFGYGTRKSVLNNINMEIKQGERVALVGESGSGKSTLVKLLMNFYQADTGDIVIDGYNIQDIAIDSLRNRIAYVPQDTFLFSGSIKENLELGNDGPSMNQVIDAARMAKAHEFINDLPLRYNTKLEENGTNLSGGQRQRLSITRAILKQPDILILDEATSSLDTVTEKAIEDTLSKVTEDITSIVIAHRLSTIMKCDRIYVMDKGQIVESGDHNSLLDKQGAYFDMWREQLPDNQLEVILSQKEVV
jgi:ATP-binding cassette subfamily B protein